MLVILDKIYLCNTMLVFVNIIEIYINLATNIYRIFKKCYKL